MNAILLYGATGYSGRLIAARAQQRWSNGKQGLRLIVAGRTGQPLHDLARRLGVESRTFTLDDGRAVDAGLEDVSTVINAAGPFASTAEPMAKAALRSGCHYVDINGEVDVYKRLDDSGYLAEQRGLTMVCGAGHSAMASNLLLEGALRHLEEKYWTAREPKELGAVRIALSQIDCPSRGSLQTALRTVREQVLVVRDRGDQRPTHPNAPPPHDLVLTYVPLGQLERTFDFGPGKGETVQDDVSRRQQGTRRPLPPRRIASAVNLIDTLTARLTLTRHVDRVLRIESYLESSDVLRTVHQTAALTAPFWWLSAIRGLAGQQIDLLPEGPTDEERAREQLSVVVEIEGLCGEPLINWRLETPSAYDFTACSVVAVAERMPRGPASGKGNLVGWRTPGEFLVDKQIFDPCRDAPLNDAERGAPIAGKGFGCRLDRRVSVERLTVVK